MATILIVDDHIASRRALALLLASEGHRVIEAADGSMGLALAAAQRPDLVIVDILMPRMNGYQFAGCLNATLETPIPLIFYTSLFSEQEAQIFKLPCGRSFVFGKPSQSETVLNVVGQALSVGG